MITFQILVEKIIGTVNETEHRISYVPLLQDISSILEKDDVMDSVMANYEREKAQKSSEYVDYCDGSLCREHELFSSDELTLRINLYTDSFNCCNPLGIYRNRHKLDGVYWTLGNLPRKYRSNLQNIRLAILAKSATIKVTITEMRHLLL